MEDKPPTQRQDVRRSRTPQAPFRAPEQPAAAEEPAEPTPPRRPAKAAPPVTFQPPSSEGTAGPQAGRHRKTAGSTPGASPEATPSQRPQDTSSGSTPDNHAQTPADSSAEAAEPATNTTTERPKSPAKATTRPSKPSTEPDKPSTRATTPDTPPTKAAAESAKPPTKAAAEPEKPPAEELPPAPQRTRSTVRSAAKPAKATSARATARAEAPAPIEADQPATERPAVEQPAVEAGELLVPEEPKPAKAAAKKVAPAKRSPRKAPAPRATTPAEPTAAEPTAAEPTAAEPTPPPEQTAAADQTAGEPPAATPGQPGAVVSAQTTLPTEPPTPTDRPSVDVRLAVDRHRTEAWAKIVADPGHSPELLALAAVQTLGPRAKEWASRTSDAYPTATSAGKARLAVRQLTRFGTLSSVFAAVAGSYSPLALLGTAAVTQAELVLHIAAAYGLDPTDEQRAADLLVLTKAHPSREEAEAAINTAKQPAYEDEDGGIVDAGWRLGRMLAAQAGGWAVIRTLNRFFPGASLLTAVLTSRSAAEALAARAERLYSQESQAFGKSV